MKKIGLLYVAATVCSLVARIPYMEVLWAIYIPLVSAANFLLFDALVNFVDFSEIKRMKNQEKGIYLIGLSILAGAFAIASVLFLK